MKIETKYNIGDEVFFMDNNRVEKGFIDSIRVAVFDTIENVEEDEERYENKTRYTIKGKGHDILFKGERLFLSKEELLKSL